MAHSVCTKTKKKKLRKKNSGKYPLKKPVM